MIWVVWISVECNAKSAGKIKLEFHWFESTRKIYKRENTIFPNNWFYDHQISLLLAYIFTCNVKTKKYRFSMKVTVHSISLETSFSFKQKNFFCYFLILIYLIHFEFFLFFFSYFSNTWNYSIVFINIVNAECSSNFQKKNSFHSPTAFNSLYIYFDDIY